MFSSIKVPDLPSSITFFSLLAKFPRTLFPGQAACKTIYTKKHFQAVCRANPVFSLTYQHAKVQIIRQVYVVRNSHEFIPWEGFPKLLNRPVYPLRPWRSCTFCYRKPNEAEEKQIKKH